jgi:hypothetical protein
MKPLNRAAVWLFARAVLMGCASTEVTERQRSAAARSSRPMAGAAFAPRSGSGVPGLVVVRSWMLTLNR